MPLPCLIASAHHYGATERKPSGGLPTISGGSNSGGWTRPTGAAVGRVVRWLTAATRAAATCTACDSLAARRFEYPHERLRWFTMTHAYRPRSRVVARFR